MRKCFCGDLNRQNRSVSKGDVVLVQFDLPAVKLAECLHAKILEMGCHPVMRVGRTRIMEHDFYEKSNDEQLTFKGSWDEELYRHINGRIFLHAPHIPDPPGGY